MGVAERDGATGPIQDRSTGVVTIPTAAKSVHFRASTAGQALSTPSPFRLPAAAAPFPAPPGAKRHAHLPSLERGCAALGEARRRAAVIQRVEGREGWEGWREG